MDNIQFLTIIGMLGAGFGWLIHQLNDVKRKVSSLEKRVTVIETILSMMGMPMKNKGN